MILHKLIIDAIMLVILIACVWLSSDYLLNSDVPPSLLIVYGQFTMVFAHYWGKFSNFLEDIK